LNIAFIGGGNMARSLIGGLVARGVPAAAIHVAEPVEALREALAKDFGVSVFDHKLQAVVGTSTWVLAVKPQLMRPVCERLAPLAQAPNADIIEVAGGCGPGWHRGPYGGCRRNYARPYLHACPRGWYLGRYGRCRANGT